MAKLQQLTSLGLGENNITDVGIKEVAKLKKLTSLDLAFCLKITDVSLKEVAKLKKLKALFLDETQVTKAGLAQLQKALPNCKIISNAKK